MARVRLRSFLLPVPGFPFGFRHSAWLGTDRRLGGFLRRLGASVSRLLLEPCLAQMSGARKSGGVSLLAGRCVSSVFFEQIHFTLSAHSLHRYSSQPDRSVRR
ncbi:hypothetical protein AOLI_G00061200 [Acnodon oligacanthus]